jgi:hypothetical protein
VVEVEDHYQIQLVSAEDLVAVEAVLVIQAVGPVIPLLLHQVKDMLVVMVVSLDMEAVVVVAPALLARAEVQIMEERAEQVLVPVLLVQQLTMPVAVEVAEMVVLEALEDLAVADKVRQLVVQILPLLGRLILVVVVAEAVALMLLGWDQPAVPV